MSTQGTTTNLQDEIEDLRNKVHALESDLTAADDEYAALEVTLDAERGKVGMYREGNENLRQLLLVAVGGDDVPVLYEDKSASDLAIDAALLIQKLADQKFKPGSIRGSACGVVREMIEERLLEGDMGLGDPDDALSVHNDLEEIVVEMTGRALLQDPKERRLLDAVDKLVPVLKSLGYLETGHRGSVDRVKVIEGAQNLIRRRVGEPNPPSEGQMHLLDAKAEVKLPSLSALASRVQGTTRCDTCSGKGNVATGKKKHWAEAGGGTPEWIVCAKCEGKGSVRT